MATLARLESPELVNVCASLIGSSDPPVVECMNQHGSTGVLLVCDHASHTVPWAMNRLGLSEDVIRDHIGWDIGAAEVTRRLSELLDAPAILAGYSRLLIDCNRPPEAGDRVPTIADGIMVPGNRDLDENSVAERVEAFFRPYHDAIRSRLDAMLRDGGAAGLVSIHSFTPVMDGVERPQHVCVCWERDVRLARPLIEVLREEPELQVGENVPFAIEGLSDYTIPEHGTRRGIPHVLVEIRNDQLRDRQGIEAWAVRLSRCLKPLFAELNMQTGWV